VSTATSLSYGKAKNSTLLCLPHTTHSFKSDKPHPSPFRAWYGTSDYLNFDDVTPATRRGGRPRHGVTLILLPAQSRL